MFFKNQTIVCTKDCVDVDNKVDAWKGDYFIVTGLGINNPDIKEMIHLKSKKTGSAYFPRGNFSPFKLEKLVKKLEDTSF